VRTRNALTVLLLLLAAPVAAQGGPELEVTPLAANSPPAGASVRGANLLAGGKLQELMRSGFPAAMSFRLELWRVGGVFNELESQERWNVLVRYDPYTQRYHAVRRQGTALQEDFGAFSSFAAVEAVLSQPFAIVLPPRRAGTRYYYNVVVDIEALSVSDLDELDRWLRGELRPAVRGKRAPLSALRRGLGTLLSRVLGGETRHYEARSGTFRA
jgi:hypothetical protein